MSDEQQSRPTFVGVADKIGEPWHTADIFVCYFVQYQPAQQQNADCITSLFSASSELK